MTTTLKEQARKSGLFLSEERAEWNENDWPPLEGGFRAFHATVVLDPTVVVMGGVKREGATNSVLVLNLAEPEKQWREGPPINKKRSQHAAVVCNGGVYVVGGEGNDGSSLDCIEYINANDLLEPSSTSTSTHESHWTTLNRRLSTRREGCCAVAVHNRYLVVMGGWDGEQSLSSVDILDTSDHTVMKAPSMIAQRVCCSSAVVGHRIFVVGGYGMDGDLDSVEMFDFATPCDNDETTQEIGSTFNSPSSAWITHSDLVISNARNFCAVVAVGSCLVVAGGLGNSAVQVLDTYRNRVWNLPPCGNRRNGCTMVTFANQVAVIGGYENPRCATLPLMDKNTWCFRRLLRCKSWN